jgi:hypothetical protein
LTITLFLPPEVATTQRNIPKTGHSSSRNIRNLMKTRMPVHLPGAEPSDYSPRNRLRKRLRGEF